MADALGDTTIDSGLTYLDTLADTIHICSAEPTSYANTLTVSLGNKAFSPGAAVGSPADGAAGGRQVATTAFVDGTVTSGGTATKWALVDSVNSKLLHRGSLSASKAVISGGQFALNAITITLSTGIAFDADVASWVDAVVTNGGTVSEGRQIIVTNFVAGLKAAGIWTKIDSLWLYAAENTQSALTDLKAHLLSTVSATSPTFTTDRGYTGNGTSSYINTNFDPTAVGGNYVLDSACLGFWDITTSSNSAGVVLGSNYFGHLSDVTLRYTDGQTYVRVNSATGTLTLAYAGAGLYVGNRSATSASQLYRNGSSIDTDTGASTVMPVSKFYVLARDTDSGTPGPTNYSTDQIAAVLFGGSLNSTEQTDLYNLHRTYMTAVGVP